MPFKSKTEAYTYALYVFNQIEKEDGKVNALCQASSEMQRLLSRHEQNPHLSCHIIQSLIESEEIHPRHHGALAKVSTFVRESDYQQTPNEKYHNPLGRRIESQLMIEIAHSPTLSIMSAIGKQSEAILHFLKHYPDRFTIMEFLRNLTRDSHEALAFSAWEVTPCVESVKKLLEENKPSDFLRIMFVHFKFARDAARRLKYNYRARSRTADCISNEQMYDTPLYAKRGRVGQLKGFFSKKMGIVREYGNGMCSASLPSHQSEWVPDALGQDADLTADFTRDLIENDTPYVAGVSGMTSMLIAAYLSYAEEQTSLEEQRLYIVAIASYIVSGGFHSIHEVLAPIAFCLSERKLLPDYEFRFPNPNQCGLPPNYDYFFAMLISIDLEVGKVLEAAWHKVVTFFELEYLPLHGHLTPYQSLLDSSIEADPSIEDPKYSQAPESACGSACASGETHKPQKLEDKNNYQFFQASRPDPKGEERKKNRKLIISL